MTDNTILMMGSLIYFRAPVRQIAFPTCKSNLTQNFLLNWHSRINRTSRRRYSARRAQKSTANSERSGAYLVSLGDVQSPGVEVAVPRWSSRPYIFPRPNMDIHSRMYINYSSLWPGSKETPPYFSTGQVGNALKCLTYSKLRIESIPLECAAFVGAKN